MKHEWMFVAVLCLGFLAGICGAQERFQVEVIQPESVAPTKQKPYWVMYSATYCGPCQRWKSTEKAKLEQAGYAVTVVMIDTDSGADRWVKQYGVTTVPRFYLHDRQTRKVLAGPLVGFQSAVSMIQRAAGKRVLAPASRQAVTRLTCTEIRALVRSKYPRERSLNADVSPQSMVWGHLTDGSGGTHTFTHDQVSCLSMWEALALHDDAHSGHPAIRPVR